MEERFDTDFPKLNPRKYMPGAMGVQMIAFDDPEQGYKIYYHSSMKQDQRPTYTGNDVHLAESLENLIIRDDGTIPIHRRKYRCTEPGLFTNSETEYPGSAHASRFYIVDKNGQFLPPCERNLADDANVIGCEHILATAEAITVPGGPGSSTTGDTISYHWYHPEQIRPSISCRMGNRKSSQKARMIAREMVPDAADREAQNIICKVAQRLMMRMCVELDKCVASKMKNRLHFDDAFQKVSEAGSQIAPQMALQIAQEICPEMDDETISEIRHKVNDAVNNHAACDLATRATVRSMSSISLSKSPHPVESMTPQQLRYLIGKQEVPQIMKDLEANVKAARAAGDPSALKFLEWQKWSDEQERREKETDGRD